MKKVTQILKRRTKSTASKASKAVKAVKKEVMARNPLAENTRKLLSGDINFFNKLKEKNLRRRLSIV